MEPILKRVAGLDIHREMIMCTLIKEHENGEIKKTTKAFKSFRKDILFLAKWLKEEKVELAVMESTSIYWKSVYEGLENEEILPIVVNARHIKSVPGRKTDVKDSEWLAELGRCGLLRKSFIPPRDLRELRLITRYRRKVSGILASEKNRLNKILDDGGVRLGCVVSDIDGVSAKKMVKALAAGEKDKKKLADMAVGSLKKKKRDLMASLDGGLGERHRFMLKLIENHIEYLFQELDEIDEVIEKAMDPYQEEWIILQTIPGVDRIGAAILLAEIGVDMSQFGKKERLCSWAGMCPGNNESAGKKKVESPTEGTTM